MRIHFRKDPLGLMLAWLAGVYLVLAVPVSVPGGAVERVQANLIGLNILVLLTGERLALLTVLLLGALAGAVLYGITVLLVALPSRTTPPSPPDPWSAPLERGMQRGVHFPWQMSILPAHVYVLPWRKLHLPWHEILLPGLRVLPRWLKYALPMLLVWGLYLLAFWPAMMSGDSFNQWQQARTGQFETGHPLLDTLYLWFWMQLWDSPSMVALVQVLALALLTAWGLGQLRKHGLPEWAAWGVSALFALSPVNGTMTISIWKDIPYSIAVFALSLLILLLSLDADWRERLARDTRRALGFGVVLGLVCVVVGLFRLNGILIVPLVLPLLMLVYRRCWKTFATALAVFALAWAVVQGPLPALLNVQEKSVINATIALHHIAAHLYNGTPVTPAERAVLEKVMPLDQWGYYCYSINPIQANPALNKSAAIAATGDLYKIALNFFLRSPTVDVEHMLCASSLIYRVDQTEEAYLLAMQIISTDTGLRYLSSNPLGFEEAPVLPGLTALLIPFLSWTNMRGVNAFFWRPAVPLYLLLWIGIILILRARRRGDAHVWRAGLFLLPALIQTAGLFITNISQSFRYQYAVYLVALFALALLFLPQGSTRKVD